MLFDRPKPTSSRHHATRLPVFPQPLSLLPHTGHIQGPPGIEYGLAAVDPVVLDRLHTVKGLWAKSVADARGNSVGCPYVGTDALSLYAC